MSTPNSKTSFELYTEAQNLFAQAHDPDIDEALWLEMAQTWVEEAEDKLLAIRIVRTGLLARAQDAKTEGDRYLAMAKRHKAAAARVDEYAAMLLSAMGDMADDKGKVATADGGWAQLRNYPKVDDSMADLDVLAAKHPDLVKVVTKVDKAEAKRQMKVGVVVPGLRMIDNFKVAWSK